MKTIRIRFRQDGMHTRMRVFVGETGTTLANAGHLAMRPDEAEAFFTALQTGPNGPIGSNMPVEIGLDSTSVAGACCCTNDPSYVNGSDCACCGAKIGSACTHLERRA